MDGCDPEARIAKIIINRIFSEDPLPDTKWQRVFFVRAGADELKSEIPFSKYVATSFTDTEWLSLLLGARRPPETHYRGFGDVGVRRLVVRGSHYAGD